MTTYRAGTCSIGSMVYYSFDAGLAAVQDGQTINMEASIVYNDTLVVNGKSFTIDLGKYDLQLNDGIEIINGTLTIDGSGKILTVNSQTCGISVTSGAFISGSSVTTNVTAASFDTTDVAYGVCLGAGSELTLIGDVTAYGGTTNNYGVYAADGSTANIRGYVKATGMNPKAKQMKISYKKVSGAEGYRITYATNKKFTKGKKTVFVKGSVKSKTVKKLKKGTTYYVKVEAYKTDSTGKKIYGAKSSGKLRVER